VASRSEAVDSARTFKLDSERELDFSPLDALLGIDGSVTRLLEVLVWGAGDVSAEAAGRSGKATGEEIVAALATVLDRRADDLIDLRRAAIAWLGNDTLPKVSSEATASALDALTRLSMPARVVAAYDTSAKDGGLWDLVVGYESDDLIALAAVETMILGTRPVALARCAHCELPFIARHRTETYCRRSAPGLGVGSRTCQDVGPQKRYAAALGGAEAIYRKNYKRLDNQVRRGALSRAEVDLWRDTARAALAKAKAENWSDGQYASHLQLIEPEGDD
jgi:hypothetical protein